MFTNFVKIIFRNLLRNKAFSFINILGLSIGISCFLILAVFVIDEMGYDTFNEKADRIYRVYISSDVNGNASNTSKTPAPLGSQLKSEFPEIESFTRLGYFGMHELRYKDKLFREGSIYTADSTYFEIFTLPFLYGNPKTALSKPNSIVITEQSAEKYFGSENPLGKQFIANGSMTYNITGVMKNFPKKSHFACNFLLSSSTYHETEGQNWINNEYTTYVLFKQNINPAEFDKKLERIVTEKVFPFAQERLGINLKEFLAKGNRYGYFLQPLKSIYLYSQAQYGIELNTEWGQIRNSNIYYNYIFIAIGVFILLIAVFNFMNLTTAKSDGRAKEVGVRKTLGSDRSKLIWQFITESTITCFFSAIIAFVLVKFILPFFNDFLENQKELSLNLFDNFYTIPILLLFTLVVGFLAGSYPAFYLSSFQPSHILKAVSNKRKTNLRSVLVIVQFAISITLIIGVVIIRNQLDYVLNKDLGFSKDRLVVINNASALGNRVEAFKHELSKIPNVVSSTNSSVMFQSGIPGGSFQIEGSPEEEFKSCQFIDADYDFARTYKVKLVSGRYFDENYSTDTSAVVINEAAARIFGTGNPVGKILYKVHTSTKGVYPYRIVGVVKDFNYESLHQNIRPLVFCISHVRQAAFFYAIRIKSEDYASTIKTIKKTWGRFTNGRELNCFVLNEKLERMYITEIKVGQITTVFSFIATFIACLGLFGLAAFITEKRIKEIGIRKVLGASIVEIIMLLSKEFTKWVLIANIIAWPVAYYVMNNWLMNFAYRTEISFWVFLISGITALLIALFTICAQIYKAASSNPIESLKYE
ncbi:MAG: FtsX-like permease family protein [Ignavibacteria bacterium]|nr:FtsX-like permease family protein [Ignavibacteria bacterium]